MQALLERSSAPIRRLFEFQSNPYGFFDQMKPENLRSLRELRLGFKKFYFCYHPDQAKHILQDNKENYPKSSLVLKKILPLSGPSGLIQLSDAQAKDVRQIAGKLMHPERAQRLSEFVAGFVAEEFERFDQCAQAGESVDLKPFLTQLVLRTAGIFILNQDIQSQSGELNEAFVELNRMAGESLRSLVTFPYSRKRNYFLGIIHRELDKIINERLREKESSLLHELNDKGFSRDFIRDQVKAFMFAGYDTTASSLIFAVDSIARSSAAQEKVYGERRANHRSALFTQAVYKESLRLYPSAYFLPRQVKANDLIMGQEVTAGSQVFISIKHVQRSAEFYQEPDKFLPERFLAPLNHSHVFLPFGGGPRICIGAPLAIMEATVVLQKLCERYQISPVNQEPPEIEGLITAHTKSPLLVRLQRRVSC